MMRSTALFILLMGILAGCNAPQDMTLPEPVSNNAVAYHAQSQTVYSFAGLGASKDFRAVHSKAYKCVLPDNTCTSIPPLPDGIGRLAATAQSIGDTIYIFGGYSVAEDGTEVSTPQLWTFNVKSQNYSRKTGMPVPVDDSVSAAYNGRYIYLISGWHKDDNVRDVQIYDSHKNTWAHATQWPGVPVFGHAGAIVGPVIVICDGVQIIPPTSQAERRKFTDISACWRGDIEKTDPSKINWRKLPKLPGSGHYRMAATGWPTKNLIVFAGGSDNPYNYNGIGYDKTPSKPSAHVWGYDISADEYILFKDKPKATMDHRALIHTGENHFLTLGGMGKNQTVLDSLDKFKARQLPK